jgi:soluble lytic murein transglycosylase
MLTSVFYALLLGAWVLANNVFAAEPVTPALPTDNNPVQRELYKRALDALAADQHAEYQTLHDQLTDYVLLPYLDYAELSPRLAALAQSGGAYADVDKFLDQYRNTYLGNKLEQEWATQLAGHKRWADLVRYFNPNNSNVELTCNALRARHETGDSTFLDDVGKLWNVATSQPNACDTVFDAWIAAGKLTPEIIWQRFSKTLKARHHTLARYIATLMPPREQALADLYLRVDSKPELLNDPSKFSEQGAQMREIILHGLQRLAQIDARMALQRWQDYRAIHDFDAEQQLAVQRYIVQRLLSQDRIAEGEALLTATPALISTSLTEWILRDALKQQDWPRIESWLARLPEEARGTERWQYWRGRMLLEKDTAEANAEAREIYRSLAQLRSIYGFMAADFLKLDYALVDKPVVVNQAEVQALYDFPAIARAHELYFIGDEFNARHEWDYATTTLAPEQILAAGKLAESWGWFVNGIQAMIKVSYWDDLQLRFPLAYGDLIADAANANSLSPLFLYAIARQESAFIHDAHSSAGALGLMQLMPTTGAQMAKDAGMNFTRQSLLQPATNITLGSRYLAQLLQQFNGNRILTAAAYNAGPNRVKRWLNDDIPSALPYDIWIETIPFGETRSYVQNVLAYAVIYGYRTGAPAKLFTGNETGTIGLENLAELAPASL